MDLSRYEFSHDMSNNNLYDHSKLPKLLKKNKNFLSTFSTFDVSCCFEYNGLKFKTVQHALQYMKYSLQKLNSSDMFSLKSNSALSKRSARRANRIGLRLPMSSEQKKTWNAMEDILIAEITEEKYAQNAHTLFAQLLCATENKELWCIEQNNFKKRAFYLEHIRERLQLVINVVNLCFE